TRPTRESNSGGAMDYRDYRDEDDRYREYRGARPRPYPAGGRMYETEYRGDRGREPRGLMERAADEMRSWFGDEGAERRRREDEREGHWGDEPRDRGGWTDREARYSRDRQGRDRDDFDERRWARQWGYIDPSEARGARSSGWSSGVYPGVSSEARNPEYGRSRESGVYPGVPS